MLNSELQHQVIKTIVQLKQKDHQFILVHGGGPFIADQLKHAGIKSEFIDGHRKTTPEAMPHVEMALKGKVNGKLVSLFNKENSLALGISGKDAQTVMATKRIHEVRQDNGKLKEVNLGQVGDVKKVNGEFLTNLLEQNITPVIACIGTDENGEDYNINADMMAGHIAGELQVDHFLVLTDIDGLRKKVSDPSTHINQLSIEEAESLFDTSIKGGMIPKVEACILALKKGAHEATIINGTKPQLLIEKLINNKNVGTSIIS